MTAIVSLRGVRVAYGSHPALVDVGFDIGPGERVALVGPSGAGKTTLLSLCNGSVAAGTGQVRVLDVDLPTRRRDVARRLGARIGTVRQQLDMVGPLKVVHNVNAGRLGQWSTAMSLTSLVRPRNTADARDALEKVGIADKLLDRTDRLSGGERQRVALARVLVQRPELILADEPVASLDPAHAEEVMDLLCEVVAGRQRTLLVSLHDFDMARRRCDRIIGVRGGAIMFDLPAGDVDDQMGRDLYRLQR